MNKFILLLVLFFSFTTTSLAQTEPASDINQKVEVKVFPNPAKNILNILGLQNTMSASILIRDVYGTIVLQHQWKIKNKALNIPVANLANGIYLITIQSPEQHIQTKFYKQ